MEGRTKVQSGHNCTQRLRMGSSGLNELWKKPGANVMTSVGGGFVCKPKNSIEMYIVGKQYFKSIPFFAVKLW
jgi:hypothetical protein